jgi:phospholipase C
MNSFSRRRFLGASAGGLAAGLVPPSIRAAMAIPAHSVTGTVQDVQHIVVFMQENRAFDHYFGTLNGVRGFGDPRPLRLPGGRTVWQQPSSEHKDGYVLPFYGESSSTASYTVDGSDQGHQAAITIVNRGLYDRWGASGELHKRMVYYRAADLPYYHALADAFTICDQYHCSTLTQTYPNRLHLMTGCNGGGKVGGDPVMDNYGEDETPSANMDEDQPLAHGPLRWTTYAERLEAAGISWKIYQEYDNFGDNVLSVFAPFRPCDKDSPLYQRGRCWVSESHDDPAERTRSDGDQLVAAFRADVSADRLPQVSVIVSAADLSEHPTHEPAKGEDLCAKLVEALVASPEVFAKTVFIINYDEAGGFFDHMPPPRPPLSPEDGFSTVPVDGEAKDYGQAEDATRPNKGRHPLGLGIRVPALIVSPWSRGGYVCSELFDHTSVLRFIEARFGVREENISDWRRAVCGDLTSAFDFRTPNQERRGLNLPSTADAKARIEISAAAASLTIPAVQTPTHQPGRQRRYRPLPYQLSADLMLIDGRPELLLDNRGSAGAVFQLFDNHDRQGPWRYSLGAGHSHRAAPWRAQGTTGYDLALHGPAGFYRRFAGDLAVPAGLVLTLEEQPAKGRIVLRVENRSDAVAQLEVRRAKIYGGGVRPLTVTAGAVERSVWPLAASDHWYDLTVTLAGAPSFLWRYAGHVETGRDSRTDPAIGKMVIT